LINREGVIVVSNDKDQREERSTKKEGSRLIVSFMKFCYYLFICFCFAALFALFTVLVGDLLVGEVNNFYGAVKGIILSITVLSVLFLINKKSVIKGFEYIAFSKVRGIPIGMMIIGIFLFTIFDSLLLLLFNVRDNTFFKVVNLAISMIISVPLYGILSVWYFEKAYEK
jgi:hypothetical protein